MDHVYRKLIQLGYAWYCTCPLSNFRTVSLNTWFHFRSRAVPQKKRGTGEKRNTRCSHNAKFPLVEIDVPVNHIWYVVIIL